MLKKIWENQNGEYNLFWGITLAIVTILVIWLTVVGVMQDTPN